MAVLIGISVAPVRGPAVDVPLGLDKWAHGAMYAVLGWLAARAAIRSGASRAPAWGIAMTLSVLYGAGLEWLQGRVGREPSFADGVADAIGAAVGAGALIVLESRTRYRERP